MQCLEVSEGDKTNKQTRKNHENQGTTKQTDNQQDVFGGTIISASVEAGVEATRLLESHRHVHPH